MISKFQIIDTVQDYEQAMKRAVSKIDLLSEINLTFIFENMVSNDAILFSALDDTEDNTLLYFITDLTLNKIIVLGPTPVLSNYSMSFIYDTKVKLFHEINTVV